MQSPFTGSAESWKAPEFLAHLRPDGPWALTAIIPDGTTTTRVFALGDVAAMEQFISQANVDRNVYFALNPAKTNAATKAKKADIASVTYLHVDADPAAEETPEQFKDRLLPQVAAFHLQPTFIVDSGNGIQLLWRLAQPVPVNSAEEIADIEDRNKALAQAFGADPSTRNIDRILRLPGTVNLPNRPKRKAGRVPVPAQLIAYNAAAEYALDAFPKAEPDKAKTKERPAEDTGKPTKRRMPVALRLMLRADGEKPGGYASRSDLLWAFLGYALRLGYDEHDIITACLDPAYQGCSIFEHCADNKGEEYVRHQIEKAINDPGMTDEEHKQIIRVQGGSLHSDWRRTERALIKAGCPVYVRGDALVQPLWRWEKSSSGQNDRGTLIATFSKLNLARLRDIVGRHAVAFQKFDNKQSKWKPIDPPKDVIETLLEAGHWGFASVSGIVNSPTMRPDGSLLTEPGYDAATQLWYKPASDIKLPDIADVPTKKDALDALELFNDLLSGFPFADDVDRAVAIAGIMTCVLRGAFDKAPMFFINAPEAGTGKSYLVNVISTIATGRDASALFSTPNAEEMDKRLSAAAIEARPILNLNNLTDDLESGLLCQMITESVIDIRPFGKNDQTIPCDCRGMTIFANGNGIRIVGDLVRRTVTCRIDAHMESPEDRTFEFDPIDLVKADRGKYLAAAFTIARAYMVKSKTDEVPAVHVAGFANWAKFVQQPLVWLGAGDPFASKASAKALNPEREALTERIAILVRVFGVNHEFDAAAVRVKALDLTTEGGGYPKPRWPELTEAYGTRNGITTKSVGKRMMSDINRVTGDYCLKLVKSDPKTANTYMVVGPVPAAPPAEQPPAPPAPVAPMPKDEEPF